VDASYVDGIGPYLKSGRIPNDGYNCPDGGTYSFTSPLSNPRCSLGSPLLLNHRMEER